jgi:membrane-associated phospholipid phosphatase
MALLMNKGPARTGRPARFLLILALLLPTAGGAQEPPAAERPSLPRLALTDLREVLGAPLSWKARQWSLFGLAVAGVGAAGLLDDQVRDHERRDDSRAANQLASDFEPLGSYGAFGILGSFYLVGLVRDDDRARSVAADGLIASVIAGGVITPALKTAIGRRRPRDTAQTFDFKPFSGSASFPSGHATEAFSVAAVIASEYDSGWVKGIAYGSAALVGFARIHHQAHFLSDVVAGALIGNAVGREVVRVDRREHARIAVVPIAGPRGQTGLALDYSF